MVESSSALNPITAAHTPPFQIAVLTLFPEFFDPLSQCGVVSRAIKERCLQLTLENPRSFSNNAYHSVDERPYGGGPGMVMRYEPLYQSHSKVKARAEFSDSYTIYLSPQGRKVSHQIFRQRAQCRRPIIFICGRYEGIDQRIVETLVDEEWSIGDYVLSGGELAAMVCIDALARQLPGVLGNSQSIEEESFSNGLLEYPHYTKPREIHGKKVPEILLSGNHSAIARWRRQQALGKTWQKRPELLMQQTLSQEDDCLLQAFKVEYLKDQSKNFVDL